MEKRKFWTADELEYLKANYATEGKNCALYLGKTQQAVFAKANKLGLKSHAAKPSRAKTNEEYDNELLEIESPAFRVEDYISNNVPILHECIEGHTWKARPTHILNGSGCPVCSGNTRRTQKEYENLVPFKVLELYVNKETPILHECSKGHQWRARPGHVIRGSGCPTCCTAGFKRDEPAILYYIKIVKDNLIYYKIGVSNRTIEKRFSADTDKTITVLSITDYALGLEAEKEEQAILEKYKSFRVTVEGFLKSGGNTELFEEDILGLDNDS